MMGTSFRHLLGRYSLPLSVAIPLAAWGVQGLLWPVVSPAIWFFFYPAVFFCSWFGGMPGALVSTVLSSAIVVMAFIVPDATFFGQKHYQIWSVLMFCVMGVAFGYSQEKLRKAEKEAADARFRALVDQSLAGIYIIQDGTFRYVNQEFANIFGYGSPDDIIDKLPYRELVSPQQRARVEMSVQDRESGRAEEARYSFSAVKRDGTLIEVEVHGRSFRHEGRPAVIGVLMDITERLHAEKRLSQAATVFASTQEGVAVTDLDGKIILVNPAFSVITEYTAEEALGRNIRFLQSGRQDKSFYEGVARSLSTDGAWQGEMWNRRKGGEEFETWVSINPVFDDGRNVIDFVAVFTDMSRMRHAETYLERLALRDSLTDLPNRLLLHNRLSQAVERVRRHGGKGAVLFMDLDRFKLVNDTYGHRAGDELLRSVSERLKSRLRQADTLARVHGDEFVVVLEDVGDVVHAAMVAQTLIGQLQKPFVVGDGQEVRVGASIGIAVFPDHGEDVEQLVEHADKALYQAKASRGTFSFYNPV